MKEIIIAVLIILSFWFYDVRQHSDFRNDAAGKKTTILSETIPSPSPVPTPDSRSNKLSEFFRRYESPLEFYAKDFVEVADKAEIDYKILPAIAMVESSGGKNTPSCAPFNPFGWSSSTSPCGFWRFSTFDEAIRQVAERITTLPYYAEFKETGSVEKLAEYYNPSEKNRWIYQVNFFIKEL